jgi:hypothetical protein
MNSFCTACRLWVVAAPLLIVGLASCGQAPETATAPNAPLAAPAPAVAAPAPVPAAPTPQAVPVKELPKPVAAKPLPQVLPKPAATAPAAPTADVVAPAPAPEPVAAPAPAVPATHTQAGRVLDESGRPLVGATVMLRGTTKGTSTDASGSYSLEVPNGENTFVVGYGGYQDETASTRDGQPLNVTLLPSPTSKAKGRR